MCMPVRICACVHKMYVHTRPYVHVHLGGIACMATVYGISSKSLEGSALVHFDMSETSGGGC